MWVLPHGDASEQLRVPVVVGTPSNVKLKNIDVNRMSFRFCNASNQSFVIFNEFGTSVCTILIHDAGPFFWKFVN